MCAAQHPLEPTAPSALVVSRLFRFVGILIQSGGPAHPALRLSFSVGRPNHNQMETKTMQSNLPKWRWLIAFVAGILLFYVAMVGAALATSAIIGSSEITGLSLALAGVVRMMLSTAGIALAVWFAKGRLSDLGLTAENWRSDVLIGAAVGAGWALLELFVLIPLTGGAERSDVVASLALVGNSAWGLVGVIVIGWTVGGFSEELFFRGHIIHTLRNLLGNKTWAVVVAVIVSVVFFGVVHAYQGWIGILDVGFGGLIWAVLYLWRRRLTASIIGHGLFDTLAIIGVYFLYS
jgi:membrane protease YdiL (CAAX protease family)